MSGTIVLGRLPKKRKREEVMVSWFYSRLAVCLTRLEARLCLTSLGGGAGWLLLEGLECVGCLHALLLPGSSLQLKKAHQACLPWFTPGV